MPVVKRVRRLTIAKLGYDEIVHGAVTQIAYSTFVDDQSSVDSNGAPDKAESTLSITRKGEIGLKSCSAHPELLQSTADSLNMAAVKDRILTEPSAEVEATYTQTIAAHNLDQQSSQVERNAADEDFKEKEELKAEKT